METNLVIGKRKPGVAGSPSLLDRVSLGSGWGLGVIPLTATIILGLSPHRTQTQFPSANCTAKDVSFLLQVTGNFKGNLLTSRVIYIQVLRWVSFRAH